MAATYRLGANGVETFVQRLQCGMGAAQGQMSGREKERSSEDEQEQDKASQHMGVVGFKRVY